MKTLCLDFDGVIHSYSSPWRGARFIDDPPVPGALEFLASAVEHYHVAILSSRSHQFLGRFAMRRWLIKQYVAAATPYRDCPNWLRALVAENAFADPWEEDAYWKGREIVKKIQFPLHKPAAFLHIDDRAFRFDGTWPSFEELDQFVPWNKKEKS